MELLLILIYVIVFALGSFVEFGSNLKRLQPQPKTDPKLWKHLSALLLSSQIAALIILPLRSKLSSRANALKRW